MPKVTLADVLPNKGKLSERDIDDIRSLYLQGAAISKLAKAYGVSRPTIRYHINRAIAAAIELPDVEHN